MPGKFPENGKQPRTTVFVTMLNAADAWYGGSKFVPACQYTRFLPSFHNKAADISNGSVPCHMTKCIIDHFEVINIKKYKAKVRR